QGGVDFGKAPASGLERRLLFGTVQPEYRLACLHLVSNVYKDFLHAARPLREQRHGAEIRKRVGGRRREAGNEGAERGLQRKAGGYPVPKLEPYGIQRDFATEPLPLDVAPIEVVRQYRDQRAKEQFDHVSSPLA